MNNYFYSFLLNSYYFNKKRLDNLIINYVSKNIDKTQPIDNLKDDIFDLINNNKYKEVLNIFNYPFYYTDINTIKLDKKIKTFSLEQFINQQIIKDNNLDYFILLFDNTKKSKTKENPLKILKSKSKINDNIYILSSVLYENNDLLKIQYKNIWDLTDNEYEIRQEYFILNNKPLLPKCVIDNYEKHNGDDEYIKEDSYNHRIKYCLYEKYKQNIDTSFIPTLEYPNVDKKYNYIHKLYDTNISNVKYQTINTNYIKYHVLQPIEIDENSNISTI